MPSRDSTPNPTDFRSGKSILLAAAFARASCREPIPSARRFPRAAAILAPGSRLGRRRRIDWQRNVLAEGRLQPLDGAILISPPAPPPTPTAPIICPSTTIGMPPEFVKRLKYVVCRAIPFGLFLSCAFATEVG